MDGSTRTLPRLRLTVPLPMKTGKVRDSFERFSRPECRGGGGGGGLKRLWARGTRHVEVQVGG